MKVILKLSLLEYELKSFADWLTELPRMRERVSKPLKPRLGLWPRASHSSREPRSRLCVSHPLFNIRLQNSTWASQYLSGQEQGASAQYDSTRAPSFPPPPTLGENQALSNRDREDSKSVRFRGDRMYTRRANYEGANRRSRETMDDSTSDA